MQVEMKALRAFWNENHEGDIGDGQHFRTTELRARELEVRHLATRVVAVGPMQVKAEIPPRPLAVTPRLGSVEFSSSSLPDQVRRESTFPQQSKRKNKLGLPFFASTNRGA